jgi:general secretion pathway protein J
MTRAQSARGAPAERGFTLVELLVAFALFALLASAATLLTGSSLATFTRSETVLAEGAALARTRAVLMADLGQAAPRISLDAEGRPIQAFTLTPTGFVLVRRGVDRLDPPLQKIAWGHDGVRLLRQTWPAVDNAPPGEARTMMEGVRAVRIRVDGGRGFEAGWQPSVPQALPRAVELTLEPVRGGPLVLLFLVAA